MFCRALPIVFDHANILDINPSYSDPDFRPSLNSTLHQRSTFPNWTEFCLDLCQPENVIMTDPVTVS